MSKNDIYVSQAQLRRFDLRNGDMVFGQIRPPRESERHYGLIKVESVNGMVPEENHERVKLKISPHFPDQRIDLENQTQHPLQPPDQPDRAHRARTARHDRLAPKPARPLS
jgi:transcription termination factor Rho